MRSNLCINQPPLPGAANCTILFLLGYSLILSKLNFSSHLSLITLSGFLCLAATLAICCFPLCYHVGSPGSTAQALQQPLKHSTQSLSFFAQRITPPICTQVPRRASNRVFGLCMRHRHCAHQRGDSSCSPTCSNDRCPCKRHAARAPRRAVCAR